MQKPTFEDIIKCAVEMPGHFTARHPLRWFNASDRYVYRLVWGAWVAGFITCPLRGVFVKHAGLAYLQTPRLAQ